MELGLNILIKAVDSASNPIAKVQKSLKKLSNNLGLEKIKPQLKAVKEALKNVTKEAGKLAVKLGAFKGALLLGSTFAVGVFKSLFLDVAKQNEILSRSLANITGNAKGAKEALTLIETALRGWNSQDAANALMRLKQAGLGAGANDLKKIADIAGHTGKSLLDVANAMASLKEGSTGAFAELLGGNIKQYGNYIVAEFNDAEGKLRRMTIKQTGNAIKDAKALQQLINTAVDAKGMKGGADRFGKSWQGMIQRAIAMWDRFRLMVAEGGPFESLKKKLSSLLDTFDALEANGELKKIAEQWSKVFTDAIEDMWEAGKAIVGWCKENFLPTIENIKEFIDSLGGVIKVVSVLMGGGFVISLGAAAKAFYSLGLTIMATPAIGWIMAAITGIALAVYLLYKNWSKISGWFKNLCKGILSAFDKGLFHGLIEIFKTFSPLAWLVKALDAVTKKLFGFSLIDAGKSVIHSFLEGLKEAWQSVVQWLSGAWESLTSFLPDSVRKKLGVNVSSNISIASPSSKGTTGAATIMKNGGASSYNLQNQKVTTEVVITGKSLPQGFSVSTPKSQSDKTRINCGYAMAGM